MISALLLAMVMCGNPLGCFYNNLTYSDTVTALPSGSTAQGNLTLPAAQAPITVPAADATLVPGSSNVWTDGLNTWAGNPYCNRGQLLSPASPALDAGAFIDGFHCPVAGLDPSGCAEWSGAAPDIGACETFALVTGLPPVAPTAFRASNTVWVFCADEDGQCIFSGTREVRYGAQGVYSQGVFTDGVACNNTVFGDPIYGFGKSCEYRR